MSLHTRQHKTWSIYWTFHKAINSVFKLFNNLFTFIFFLNQILIPWSWSKHEQAIWTPCQSPYKTCILGIIKEKSMWPFSWIRRCNHSAWSFLILVILFLFLITLIYFHHVLILLIFIFILNIFINFFVIEVFLSLFNCIFMVKLKLLFKFSILIYSHSCIRR